MTQSLLNRVPVIPVVVVDDVDHAVPIARALVAGGLPVIELTLRTPVALAAIERIAGEVPEIFSGRAQSWNQARPSKRRPRAHSSSSRPAAHRLCCRR